MSFSQMFIDIILKRHSGKSTIKFKMSLKYITHKMVISLYLKIIFQYNKKRHSLEIWKIFGKGETAFL